MSEWLMETFGMSQGWARGVQVVVAFAIVFALLAAFLWVMRRLTRTGFGHGGRTRQPRLAIMDQAHIDTRRRLVLVRRDNVEHLVLVGGPSDVVVEQNIVRGQSMTPGMRAPYPAVAQPMPSATVAPAAVPPAAGQGPVGPVAAAAVAAAAATDDEMPEPPAEAVPAAETAEPEPEAPRPAPPQQQPARAAAPAGPRERTGPAGQRPRQRQQQPGLARARPQVDEAGRPLQQRQQPGPGQPRQQRPQGPYGQNGAQGQPQRQQSAEPPARPPRPEPAPGATPPPVTPVPAEIADARRPPRPASGDRPAAAATPQAERAAPAPTSPIPQPSRGPASRLSENIFARGREATSSTAGSISAAIAAAAGLAGRKGEDKPADEPQAAGTPAPAEEKKAEAPVPEDAPKVEPQVADVIAPEPVIPEPASGDAGDELKPVEPPLAAGAEPPAAESAPAEADGETVEGKPIDVAPVEPTAGAAKDQKDSGDDLDAGIEPEAKTETDDAPTVEIDSDDATADDKRSRENDSIEEEMAKLLSELSGSPDK